jgi:predicted metallopeptidase
MFQVSPIYVARVIAATFARLSGASGLVKIIAPLPASEVAELPLMLIATTLAQIY